MPSRTTFQVKLQSADGAVFEVPPQIYKSFKTITSMIEANTIVDVVLVPNVNASSLCKVLRWTEYHMDDSLEENNGYPPEICEWDRELLRVEKNMLIELVLAANYLGIQRLLDVLSLVVLDLINNQSPEIVEDSSSLDDAFIQQQNEKEYDNICMECESDCDDEDEDDDDKDNEDENKDDEDVNEEDEDDDDDDDDDDFDYDDEDEDDDDKDTDDENNDDEDEDDDNDNKNKDEEDDGVDDSVDDNDDENNE